MTNTPQPPGLPWACHLCWRKVWCDQVPTNGRPPISCIERPLLVRHILGDMDDNEETSS
jgi:hypothetical protein